MVNTSQKSYKAGIPALFEGEDSASQIQSTT